MVTIAAENFMVGFGWNPLDMSTTEGTDAGVVEVGLEAELHPSIIAIGDLVRMRVDVRSTCFR